MTPVSDLLQEAAMLVLDESRLWEWANIDAPADIARWHHENPDGCRPVDDEDRTRWREWVNASAPIVAAVFAELCARHREGSE